MSRFTISHCIIYAMFLHNVTGMAFGLFLSGICNTENAALQAAVAAFYPTILLSGTYALRLCKVTALIITSL